MRLESDDWVNLNNSLGYVPLAGTYFYSERESGEEDNFFQLTIQHGTIPANAEVGGQYAYALLPDATAEETEEFSSQPSVEILAMSETMHAVRDLETGTVGINAFAAGESLCGLTFLTPCSIIINGDEFFVTDPSQTQSSVTIKFDADITASAEDGLLQEGNTVTIYMPIRGKSYSFTANGY